ncbi:MAG: type II toxin-antitoxin system RelE/ParE family toxin [Planctomycetota bacterium]|nr:type II toxin-antitoxin system RelE/ParE family toxin [Planctomycetota bacterium]MDA1250701.1 type II toxin-antitoxin system RelE/ParE family toxin [Planctomycetota bacterium]
MRSVVSSRLKAGASIPPWGFLDRIGEKCQAYSRQPLMGDHRPDLGENIRLFPVDNYVVIYELLPEGILVLMVTRGSRDVPRLFGRRQTGPGQ